MALDRSTIKELTTHVEACMEMSRDAGSIPAASTQSGSTTRLDSNKARQRPLAGLGRFGPRIAGFAKMGVVARGQIACRGGAPHRPPSGQNRLRVSKSRDAVPTRHAMEVVANRRFAATAFFPVLRRLPVGKSLATRVPCDDFPATRQDSRVAAVASHRRQRLGAGGGTVLFWDSARVQTA